MLIPATVKAASEANTAKLAGLTKATVKAEITADVAAEGRSCRRTSCNS